jgi:hypothetical protein
VSGFLIPSWSGSSSTPFEFLLGDNDAEDIGCFGDDGIRNDLGVENEPSKPLSNPLDSEAENELPIVNALSSSADHSSDVGAFAILQSSGRMGGSLEEARVECVFSTLLQLC